MDGLTSPSTPERGRPRHRSQSFRKPFQAFKSILARKLKLNRSLSRDRSTSLPRFTSGSISHAHSVPESNIVPLYLPIHIDLSGAIIAPEETTKIGSVICSCGQQYHASNTAKHILFSSKQITQLNPDEHFVSSPFIVPEITESYRRLHKSFPILFRMDLSFQVQFGEPLGEQISFVTLKNTIHTHLLDMETLFQAEDVSHVYEKLFDVSSQVDPSLVPSAPLYDDEHEGAQQVLGEDREVAATLPFDRPVPPPRVPAENRSDLPPSSYPSSKMVDFMGILFVPNQSASLLDIPKAKNVKLVENCLKSWSLSGFKALFIVRNLVNKQIEFFPFLRAPRIDPFTPCVISPQKMFVAILNSSEVGANGSPQVSLQPTSRLSKWYRRIYQGVVDETLFSKSPSSLSFSAASSPSDSDSENKSGKSLKSVSVRSRARSGSSKQPPVLEAVLPVPSATAAPVQPLVSSLTIDVYTPPILNQQDCPELFKLFWSLKAYPRPSLSEKGKPVLEEERHVAPRYPVRMLEVAAHVNLPSLLADEFEAYAKAYQAIVIEKRYSTVDSSRGNIVHLSIQNDAAVLARLGRDKILETLKKNAPILREHRLEILTEAELQSFFFQARTYLLDNQAPYWSFPDYFLNAKTLGSDIFNKITELLWGYPTYKTTLKQFSFFIESSIRHILPLQESFTDSEERIIASHRSLLLAPIPTADHTKISLQADAQELLIKSPYYKQNKNKITEDFKRQLIDMHRSNLIIKIISNTHYEKDLIQLLIANEKYKSLDVVPFPVLISNLENLILVGQKAESISTEVNSASSGRISRPTSRSRPVTTTKTTKMASSPKSKSPRPPRPRSRNPSGGQEACDICLLYEFDPRWCRQQNHCRVPGHQPGTHKSETRERQIRSGDLSCFVLRQMCNQCNPRVMNVTTPPFQPWPKPPFSHLPQPHFPQPPPRPRSSSRPSEANTWSPWNFPPPRPANHRQSSKSPSRFPADRR